MRKSNLSMLTAVVTLVAVGAALSGCGGGSGNRPACYPDCGGGKNFEGYDFSGADLEGIDLSSAGMEGANFEGANLKNARLSFVDLDRANLKDTDFTGATVQYADFEGATWDNTTCPDGTVQSENCFENAEDGTDEWAN